MHEKATPRVAFCVPYLVILQATIGWLGKKTGLVACMSPFALILVVLRCFDGLESGVSLGFVFIRKET